MTPAPIPARRMGIAGFVALALGLHRLTADELLAFANRAAFDGYPGAADAAFAELRARAETDGAL